MQEPSSPLDCRPQRWEGGGELRVKGAGASFQSKQLKEMQPPGAVGLCSAFP